MGQQKKILVTGGAGYIGAHTLVEIMAAGATPVVIDNLSNSDGSMLQGVEAITGKKVVFYKGDVRDAQLLGKIFREHSEISAVIHFAALKSVKESVDKPLEYYENNLNSLITLVKAMQNYGVHDLIFSSSCTVYGQPDVIPVDEQAPFKHAESPYGATKQMGERILQDSAASGLRVLSLRYFNPIGAHPSSLIGEMSLGGEPNNLMPYLVETASGIRKQLTVFGNDYDTPDGSCLRDFIHVSDIARAHVMALDYLAKKEAPFCDALNLGTGNGVSVLELIHSFIHINEVSVPYVIGARRPGDVIKVFANPAKANRELGWQPRYSLEDGLKHAWQWEKKVSSI
jgi:UDP-glucose 4-epimerase